MPSFAHGIQFVPLESVRDPRLVPSVVARFMGFLESPERPATELLRELLADRHMLLVLDNLEQVTGAAGWLSDLLTHAPRLRVLVTSRIPLHIAGEQQFDVKPLATSSSGDKAPAAVDLFIQRARAINLTYTADPTTVAEICRRLDGLPLAIELAAARARAISAEALLARLTHRLSVLGEGPRDAPWRLRSMSRAIGWSYDLLSPQERRLFCRLAVFVGGFSLEAVEFISGWPEPSVAGSALDTMQSLAEQSLVQAVPGPGNQRFRMLETIREYGVERSECGDHQAHEAHADYYRALAGRAELALTGPDQAAWLDLLETEYPNVQAAVSWLAEHDRLDDAVELLTQIRLFIEMRGFTREALDLIGSWLARPELAARTRARGLTLLVRGSLLSYTTSADEAAQALLEATEILEEINDRAHAAMANAHLGLLYQDSSNLGFMRHIAGKTLELARSLNLHREMQHGLNLIAHHAFVAGDRASHARLVRDSYRLAQEHKDRLMLAYHACWRFEEAMEEGDVGSAERHAREAVAGFEALGDKTDLPYALARLATAVLRRQDFDGATRHITTAIELAVACGHTTQEMHLTRRKGAIDIERGELALAAEELGRALAWYHGQAHSFDVYVTLDAYGLLALRAGDVVTATRFLGASAAILDESKLDEEFVFTVSQGFRHRDELRSLLGPEAFGREYAAGARLGIDEAVAEALAYAPVVATSGGGDTLPQAAVRSRLSPREMEVLRLMANGLSNQEIADGLYLSLRTVTTHVTRILDKLDVGSRTAAVSFAIRQGLV